MNKILEEHWGGSWALYTSYGHTPQAPRYRICIPLDPSLDMPPAFDAVAPVAERLGLIRWLDKTKRVASSMFYSPAHPHSHAAITLARVSNETGRLGHEFFSEHLAKWQEEERQAEEISRVAAERRERARTERIATGGSSQTFIEQARETRF